MFRENSQKRQDTIFDATDWMDNRTLKKLNTSWAPIFYNEVFKKIDEQPFSILYSEKGAPNYPVNVLLCLEYIKHMKCFNDQELLEGYAFDYLVNYAVGNRRIGEKPLADRTLYNFRSRVYQYSIDHPDSDGVLYGQFIKLLTSFAEKSKISLKEQRIDTTMFMSNIKKAGRLALAYDVLVKSVKAIPEDMRSESLSAVLAPEFKTETLYLTKADENDSKLDRLMGYCKEAYEILKVIPSAKEAADVVKRFLREQSEVDRDGRLRAKHKYTIRADSMRSAFDTDATYHKKTGAGQSGYVLELTETCAEDNPFNLLIDYHVERNIVSDVTIIGDRISKIQENTGCEDMYADGGFNSPEVSEAVKDAGIELHLTNMSGNRPNKKMPSEYYEVEDDTCTITKCPAGNTPFRTGNAKGQTVAHFELNICERCELREQCHIKIQKNTAVLRLSLNSIRAGRERIKLSANKVVNTSKRAAIEGSNSALKRTGLRKLKVRGKAKCGIVAGLMATAQNVKRFIKFKLGGYDAAIRMKELRLGRSLPINA